LFGIALLPFLPLPRGRAAWRAAAAFSAPLVPWLLFAYGYFGGVLPQSAKAKVGFWQPLPYLLGSVNYGLSNVVGWRQEYSLFTSVPGLQAWLGFTLAAAGALLLVRRSPAHAVLVWTVLLYFATYTSLRPIHGAEWHLYPAYALLAVFA